MKQEKGFSLLEVLIAGSLMIGVVFAVQQLLASTSKGAGDIEKRMRHRDLVDDLRYAFFDNATCLNLVKKAEFREGEELSVDLGRGMVAKAGTDLAEYGLRVDHLQLLNVKQIPIDTFSLVLPSRQLLGQYQESGHTADLVLEARIIGALRPLKAVGVQRLTILNRTGALTEELCYGNHDLPGRSGGTAGSAGGVAHSAVASTGVTLYAPEATGEEASEPSAAPPKLKAFCYLTDEKVIADTGRDRLAEGESISLGGGTSGANSISCSGGRIVIGR